MRIVLALLAGGVALCAASMALAVPEGMPSLTAAFVCDFRAVGALHPDRRLRSNDTLAAKLCTPHLLPYDYAMARFSIERDPEAYAGYYFVNARTRHIDGQVRKAAARGIRQVVVLGAGFDSRAYRFHKLYPQLRFFEVDLPASSEAKQRAVTRLFGALPSFVRYVRIDFATQTLDAVLPAAGYDARRKSLFIIEGVLMYVHDQGNRATFEFIRRHSPAGSMVVYDYVLRRVVKGDYAGLYAAEPLAKGVASLGEPFVSGWTPAEAAEFAQQHGLAIEADLDFVELTRRYLTGSRGQVDGRLPDWQRIIDATVR